MSTANTIQGDIDRAPLCGVHWLVLFFCGATLLFDGFDFQATAYVVPLIRHEWALDPKALGALISIGFLGLFVGAIIAAYISDLIGRKVALAVCTFIYALFTAGDALAPSYTWFAAFRFLAGLGLGGLIPIATAWMTEFLPIKNRAAIIAATISVFLVGWILASGVALAIIPTYGWRAFFAIGALPVLFALGVLIWGPESPIWLAAHGRSAEALTVLRRINPAATLPTASRLPLPPARTGSNWFRLFNARHLKSTIIIALLYFCISAFSAGILQWLPTQLLSRGMSIRDSYLYTLVVSLGPVIGTCAMGALLDVWGRRLSFIVFWIGTACFTVLFAFASSPGMVMFCGFGLTFFGIATFTCLDVITAEIYPTEVRASAVGWGMGIGRLGGAFGPLLGGYLIAMGISYTAFFLVFAIPPLLNIFISLPLRYAAAKSSISVSAT